jgi:hypothetical protein
MTALHKLGNDLLVTYNSAGILRVPDTTNTGIKNKKVGAVRGETRVRFVSEGSVFNMDDIQAVINNNIVGTPFETTHKPKVETGGLQLAGKRPTGIPTTATAVKLFQNTATMFKGILVKTEAGVGCGQLAHYIENASDDGMEPMWRACMASSKASCSAFEPALGGTMRSAMGTSGVPVDGAADCGAVEKVEVCAGKGVEDGLGVAGRGVGGDAEALGAGAVREPAPPVANSAASNPRCAGLASTGTVAAVVAVVAVTLRA